MNAIVRQDELPGMPEPSSILAVISRAAADPNIDVTKMERLLEMHEKIVARNAVEAYNAAFAVMQPELPVIDERGTIKVNNEIRSTFATFEDINDVVKPIITRYGFGISFRAVTKDAKATVTAILMHKAGHREETAMELSADTSGGKNGVQALGSSISYAKRYTMCALLNITTRGQDDDGRKGGSPPTLTDKQVGDLKAVITEVGADQSKLLKLWRVNSLNEILQANYQTVLELVEKKRR